VDFMLGRPASPEPESTDAKARDAALRLLRYRGRSEAEIRRRLLRRFPSQTVDTAIAKLREQGLLDDSAFAQWWRQNREEHRPRSDRLLEQELTRLGVPGDIIQETLSGYDNQGNAYAAGRRVARRILERGGSEEYFRKRLSGHLQRRGFAYPLVRDITERLWSELTTDALNGDENCDEDNH
jgi:regulatory protein